jgi:hypothetical protein
MLPRWTSLGQRRPWCGADPAEHLERLREWTDELIARSSGETAS